MYAQKFCHAYEDLRVIKMHYLFIIKSKFNNVFIKFRLIMINNAISTFQTLQNIKAKAYKMKDEEY